MSYDPEFPTPVVRWRRPIGSARTRSGHLVDGAHCQTAIILPGGRSRIWLIVMQSNGVRVVSAKSRDGMSPLMRGNQPYPIRRAVAKFQAAGRALGITQRARDGLELAVLASTVEVDRRDRR